MYVLINKLHSKLIEKKNNLSQSYMDILHIAIWSKCGDPMHTETVLKLSIRPNWTTDSHKFTYV